MPIRQLIEKEGIAALLFLAANLLLAITIQPGIGTGRKAPLVGTAAAPWIFGPVQILLYYFPPWLAALAFPLLVILVFSSLPWLSEYIGEKRSRTVFLMLGLLISLLLVLFMLKEHG